MEKFVKKNISKPLYKQVAEWMSSNIQNKVWESESKIPSEDDLARTLKVSRGTIRQAIALLINQQLLVQTQGKGTFVREDAKIAYPFAQELISYAESMEMKGYTYDTEVLEKEIINPSFPVQKKLDLQKQDVILYLKRLRSIDNNPAILLENWVSLKHCKEIHEEDFNFISLFKAIEKHVDTEIAYGVRDFSASSLDEQQAKVLNLRKKSPVLLINQIIYDQKDSPIECSRVFLRSDKYKITSTLNR